jgi:porin
MKSRALILCGLTILFPLLAIAGDPPVRTGGPDSLALLATAAANPAPSASAVPAPAGVAESQRSGFLTWTSLTGNWSGVRSGLEGAGLTLNAMYRTDQISDINGGNEPRGASINQLDLQVAIDADAAVGIHGLSLFAHVIANNGGSISKWVGDVQFVSNIEATRVTKLYQLWIRQSFADDHMSGLVGLYDLNSEFYVTDGATLFLNSSFGVGKELAQTGVNGPGIYPNPALTLRLRGQFGDVYAQTAVIDGHPGSVEDPFTPSFSWSADEGVLVITEAGVINDGSDGNLRFKFAAGAWWYPSSVESSLPNGGAYVMAEHQMFRENGAGQGLSMFTRLGVADLRVNRFRSNISGGAVYTGLIPGRDEDRVGLAVTVAGRNRHFASQQDAEEIPLRDAEMSFEMTYRIQLLPSIAVQPDFQYVIAPRCAPGIDNASVLGIRFEGHF